MASQQLTASYDAAVKAQPQQPAEAVRLFRDIALGSHPNDADSVKVGLQANGHPNVMCEPLSIVTGKLHAAP